MHLIKVNSWTLGAPYHHEACLLGAVALGFKHPVQWNQPAARLCVSHYRRSVQLLEGLVYRVIAQLFTFSGQPGLGVFMRESVLVRLGVVRQRYVFVRFAGEDDNGI